MTNSGDAAENVVMSLYELTFMCIKNYWKGLINDIFLNETGRSVYFAVPVLCLLKKGAWQNARDWRFFSAEMAGSPSIQKHCLHAGSGRQCFSWGIRLPSEWQW